MTPHIESKKEDISKIVLSPGDPLRAKYIADNFLENARLVNSVRNMFAYTGTYKGKEITVFASGMGMPSMGIYCYELYNYYDVDTIIRIGSCGAGTPDVKIFDTILADECYTESNFALTMNDEDCHIVKPDYDTTSIIEKIANRENIDIVKGTTVCTECFDLYVTDIDRMYGRIPKDLKILGAEMEAFSLFYTAKVLNKKAACLLTVVDSKFQNEAISSEARQTSLNNMITLALESALEV